jgi:putative transposase
MHIRRIKMANTYTQLYIHYVFATHRRLRLIHGNALNELYDYSAGLIRDLNCFLQCIGGMDDHIHLLVGLNPTLSVSDFAQRFKANTSRFINERGWVIGKFNWQNGFGAFSVSQSGLEQVRDYIAKQKEHHVNMRFMAEYETLLGKYRVIYDEKYLFEEPVD